MGIHSLKNYPRRQICVVLEYSCWLGVISGGCQDASVDLCLFLGNGVKANKPVLQWDVNTEITECTYWQVPFDKDQPVTWQDRFTLDLRSHQVTNIP
jgi:hypothetical protein